jgi:hypothetical protein
MLEVRGWRKGKGYGRKDSRAEFKHFLRNSMGSCNEVCVLLDMFRDLSYTSLDVHQRLRAEYEVLGKQLNRLIQTWQTFQLLTSNIQLPKGVGERSQWVEAVP